LNGKGILADIRSEEIHFGVIAADIADRPDFSGSSVEAAENKLNTILDTFA